MKCCINCNSQLSTRHQVKFCSGECHSDSKYKAYIAKWKNNEVDGNRGVLTRNISGHLKRYLGEKFDHSCAICGWNKKHPITGTVPLEIDHIDGNSENNLENNLQLLCPNCHALTPFFKNLNKGKGRKWRMDKYIKNL